MTGYQEVLDASLADRNCSEGFEKLDSRPCASSKLAAGTTVFVVAAPDAWDSI